MKRYMSDFNPNKGPASPVAPDAAANEPPPGSLPPP